MQRPEPPGFHRPMPVRQGRLRDRHAGALGLARSFAAAAARMARPMRPMSEAGASAFASPRARPRSPASRTRRQKPRAASARDAARRCFTNAPRSPHMVNIPRALFAGRTGRQPLYHIAIEELQEWAYTGEPLVPLKGFPGVVWQRSKRKKRADHEGCFEPCRPCRLAIRARRRRRAAMIALPLISGARDRS